MFQGFGVGMVASLLYVQVSKHSLQSGSGDFNSAFVAKCSQGFSTLSTASSSGSREVDLSKSSKRIGGQVAIIPHPLSLMQRFLGRVVKY